MRLYAVALSGREEYWIDSIWSSKELATSRLLEVGDFYGKDRMVGVDTAIEEYELDSVPELK